MLPITAGVKFGMEMLAPYLKGLGADKATAEIAKAKGKVMERAAAEGWEEHFDDHDTVRIHLYWQCKAMILAIARFFPFFKKIAGHGADIWRDAIDDAVLAEVLPGAAGKNVSELWDLTAKALVDKVW